MAMQVYSSDIWLMLQQDLHYFTITMLTGQDEGGPTHMHTHKREQHFIYTDNVIETLMTISDLQSKFWHHDPWLISMGVVQSAP